MNIINNIKRVMKVTPSVAGKVGVGLMVALCAASCTTDSDLVTFADDHKLHNQSDSLYTTLGIMSKMQVLVERTNILGELRGDLTTTTEFASKDLRAIATFDLNASSKYNQISDYYSVINNCNYALANFDTEMVKRGRKVFEAEYAAVKSFRAWTYLQLALNYGEVPFITEPVLTEEQAKQAMNGKTANLHEICTYFISDIKDNVNVRLPNMQPRLSADDNKRAFIPVRLLLAELYLWDQQYLDAAKMYHEYLTYPGSEIATGKDRIEWTVTKDFNTVDLETRKTLIGGSEILWQIKTESHEMDGVYNYLEDIYTSTKRNDYYAQAVPSEALFDLSAAQTYIAYEERNAGKDKDTIYVPKQGLKKDIYRGDLRLNGAYNYKWENRPSSSKYSTDMITNKKFGSANTPIMRRSVIYLHFAEALNRAGFPQSAFAILKWGLKEKGANTISEVIDAREIAKAGELLSFHNQRFETNNTQGIHSRGCGHVDKDIKEFLLPVPPTALPTYEDTVQWQIPMVENLIIDELAIETAFEGHRYYDLMRVAKREGRDAKYLAERVAKRNGVKDEALYNFLLDEKNWYLKK